jgi:K+-sensing histidine kinase KdpD
MTPDRPARHWWLWGGVLLLVTVVLVLVRSESEQAYVPLPFLLIVLGGSAGGGRKLGFALACASFLIIDYFLQTPYDRLSFGKSIDFVTLAAFLATTTVASELLDRARKERDEALRQADEVAALLRERVRLTTEAEHLSALREADRMKDVVLASVSHDLRTPLTTIKALAQEEQRTGTSRAADIEHQADRLTRMVADLLDLARLRSGTFGVAPELNAAEDVVGAATRQCEGLLDGRRIVASFDAAAPALYGTFDFLLTLRILVNLLENALRYTPRGSDVEITARRESAVLVFSVADRGPGIAEAERSRVFDAFYRPEGSPPDRGRAGLGLAIARAFADAQGGTINYAVRNGGGSVFEVRLPATDIPTAMLEES